MNFKVKFSGLIKNHILKTACLPVTLISKRGGPRFNFYGKKGLTLHVEPLVLLSKKPDSRISVKSEFGENEGQISLAETQKQVEKTIKYVVNGAKG